MKDKMQELRDQWAVEDRISHDLEWKFFCDLYMRNMGRKESKSLILDILEKLYEEKRAKGYTA